jgi:hypothetical protein
MDLSMSLHTLSFETSRVGCWRSQVFLTGKRLVEAELSFLHFNFQPRCCGAKTIPSQALWKPPDWECITTLNMSPFHLRVMVLNKTALIPLVFDALVDKKSHFCKINVQLLHSTSHNKCRCRTLLVRRGSGYECYNQAACTTSMYPAQLSFNVVLSTPVVPLLGIPTKLIDRV